MSYRGGEEGSQREDPITWRKGEKEGGDEK